MKLYPYQYGVWSKTETRFLGAIGDGASFRDVQSQLRWNNGQMIAMILSLIKKDGIKAVNPDGRAITA